MRKKWYLRKTNWAAGSVIAGAIIGALEGALTWGQAALIILGALEGAFLRQSVEDVKVARLPDSIATKAMKARNIPIIIAGALICLGASGCTNFNAKGFRSDGITPAWEVTDTGAPLISRRSSFDVKFQWLDEATNILYETTIKRNTDEKADAQLEALRLLKEAYAPTPLAPIP